MDRIDAHRPLLTMDDAYGRHMPMYRDFIQHSTLDDYWKRIYLTPEDFARIDLPVLHITGWFDSAIPGSMFYWRGMAEHSPAGSAPTFDFPRTRIYDTGTNQWRDLDGIPHSKGKLQRLYLSGRTLQWSKPGNETPDSYVFDPLNPTPAFVDGHLSGAVPYIYPNSNTGNPVATDTESRPAKQTIYHDRKRPSNVELWVE